MERLITSYGADFTAFNEIIKRKSFLVTGGAALAAYLEQEGVEYNFKPNRMDIFALEQYVDDIEELSSFLIAQGFTLVHKLGDQGYTDESYISEFSKNGKYIQIIGVDYIRLTQYILDVFDLSICITWWDGCKGVFETLDPERTRRKEMYIMGGSLENPEVHLNLRVDLYVTRGFTLVNLPRPIINCADPRNDTIINDANVAWQTITVYDVISLEEHNIKDFLLASPNNILLKSGERYYAFDCYALMKYMNSKPCYINDRFRNICETPLNHCIPKEAVDIIRYADFTIYELRTAYTVIDHKGETRTLYNFHCYTMSQWINKEKGIVIPAPIQRPIRQSRRRRQEQQEQQIQLIRQRQNTSMISQISLFINILLDGPSVLFNILLSPVAVFGAMYE
jgi:hypothetical protein